jgi:hypothetical protein
MRSERVAGGPTTIYVSRPKPVAALIAQAAAGVEVRQAWSEEGADRHAGA